MQRRQFVRTTAAALTLGALAACASRPLRPLATTPLDAAGFRTARRYVTTRHGRIAYVERGSGPAALFLHGFPLNSYQWRGALERLSPYRRCVAPDFLGLGVTEVAAGQSVSPDAQVQMLVAVLDALSIRDVDLLANDSGGAVAQLFVTRHPERVRTMLLTNCDVENDSPPPSVLPVIKLARAGRFADEWLAPWVADKVLARSDKGIGGMTFTYPERLDDAAIDIYLGPLVSSPQRKALTNAYAVALAPNPLAGVEAGLRRCRVPTRILWGTGDTIFAQASADDLDRTLPNSRGVRRVPGAKLFWPEEFPDLVAEEARMLWGV
jgi:haloalkane dehalogenase